MPCGLVRASQRSQRTREEGHFWTGANTTRAQASVRFWQTSTPHFGDAVTTVSPARSGGQHFSSKRACAKRRQAVAQIVAQRAREIWARAS